ncbi:hypothetical protein GE09DRAFT_295396 [Coniochaeta sp. 2T2.1]|nr:hypothetical protein GE09DRAFT_295396 [Coniochaeta sp. 2T2.1]
MNCPSRTDEPPVSDGYNQSPNQFSNDLTTNADLNGISNSRQRSDDALSIQNGGQSTEGPDIALTDDPHRTISPSKSGGGGEAAAGSSGKDQQSPEKGPMNLLETFVTQQSMSPSDNGLSDGNGGPGGASGPRSLFRRMWDGFITFGKFIGPGFMVAVAYSMPSTPFSSHSCDSH